MGPDAKFAKKQADKAFKEVWKLLCEKYGIQDYDKFKISDELKIKLQSMENKKLNDVILSLPARGHFYKGWKKAKIDLKKAMRELFWEEACQSF